MQSSYSLLILFVLLAACNKGPREQDASSETKKDSTVVNLIDPGMRYLTSAEVNELFTTAEKVDIIFYNHPISVNQEDAASVKNTVMYVLPTPASVTTRCNALGRIAWIAGGTIVREADVFVGNGCNYLMFMENNQPFAANALSLEGVQFFANIISQVDQQKKQLQTQQPQ